VNLPAKWVTCDPGETTGYSVQEGDRIIAGGQAELWTFITCFAPVADIPTNLSARDPELWRRLYGTELLVLEDWHLYPDTATALAWDRLDTVRGIGALEYACLALGIELVHQPAKIKSAAQAAGAEELFVTPANPNRHQNDAIMHAVYYAATQRKALAWD
jgi:hypothetical protein